MYECKRMDKRALHCIALNTCCNNAVKQLIGGLHRSADFSVNRPRDTLTQHNDGLHAFQYSWVGFAWSNNPFCVTLDSTVQPDKCGT